MNKRLLRSCIRGMILESLYPGLQGPFKPNVSSEFTIYREIVWPFPIDSLAQAAGWRPEDVESGEWEIGLDVDFYHEKADRSVGIMSPHTSVDGWSVETINGVYLANKEDRKLVERVIGELTEDELDQLVQQHLENQDEGPDPDEYFDDSYDRF